MPPRVLAALSREAVGNIFSKQSGGPVCCPHIPHQLTTAFLQSKNGKSFRVCSSAATHLQTKRHRQMSEGGKKNRQADLTFNTRAFHNIYTASSAQYPTLLQQQPANIACPQIPCHLQPVTTVSTALFLLQLLQYFFPSNTIKNMGKTSMHVQLHCSNDAD